MRTCRLRERSISHWGQLGGLGEGQQGVGKVGRDNMGEMPDIGDEGMEATNHIAMYAPMQQSCMICTCTPEPKAQLKKEK